MRFWLFLCLLLLPACNKDGNDEIYNENNTSVANGIVRDINEKPINGLYRVYYPDGVVRMEVQSKNGKPDGLGKFYGTDGTLFMKGNFSGGLPDGTFYNYDADGKICNEINYKDGVKHGVQKSYDEDGKLTVKVNFDNGSPVSGYTVFEGKKEKFSPEELEELK